MLAKLSANSHRSQIVELAIKHRLPAICETAYWTEDGCFMSYGHDPGTACAAQLFSSTRFSKVLSPPTFPWNSQ